MASSRPMWRRTVDSIDDRLSGPLEAAAKNDATGVVIAFGARLIRGAQSKVEAASAAVLHAVNLPTAGDIRQVLGQVARVEHDVRELHLEMVTGRKGTPSRPRSVQRNPE